VGAPLKIDAFACSIVGNHHPHDRIAVEGRYGGAALLTRDPAVNHHDCLAVGLPPGKAAFSEWARSATVRFCSSAR
jgi:hypothetical protein